MKILITGCAGFIGRRLAAQFAREHEVYGATRQMAGLPAGVMPVIADLSVPSMLCGLAQGGVLPDAIDAVLHFAQSSRYREWPDGADDMFAVNVGATQRLLEYARRAGAQRFIMASTGSVYLPSAMALREDSPTSANISPACNSKLTPLRTIAPVSATCTNSSISVQRSTQMLPLPFVTNLFPIRTISSSSKNFFSSQENH